jgi:hypothetical protein
VLSTVADENGQNNHELHDADQEQENEVMGLFFWLKQLTCGENEIHTNYRGMVAREINPIRG